MNKRYLEIIVFASGMIIMILELVGSRVLAPYVGTSVYVWSSLIGVILASLSFGYWWGGRVADRHASLKMFSLIFCVAAVLILTTTFLKDVCLVSLHGFINDIRWRAVIATILLFGPASIALGMVLPFAIKMRIKSVEGCAEAVGTLFAFSTVGSIVGTFLTGFVLIPILGSTKILLLTSCFLFFISVFLFSANFLRTKMILIIVFTPLLLMVDYRHYAYLDREDFFEIETVYNRVWIYDEVDKEKGEVRVMRVNRQGESAMFLNRTGLVHEYLKYYHLAEHFVPNFNKTLMIGGAGYSYPKEYLKRFPQADIDVVEIDTGLTDLARKHFRLEDHPRLTIYHEDARTFLNYTKNRYDVIMEDAFQSLNALPYQLSTREAVQRMYDILNDDGIVMANLITAIEGSEGRFLRAEYATFQKVFPHVFLFPVQNPDDGYLVQNIMLVAFKSEQRPFFVSKDRHLNRYLQHRWSQEIPSDVPILTDDYAPVEHYFAKSIKD